MSPSIDEKLEFWQTRVKRKYLTKDHSKCDRRQQIGVLQNGPGLFDLETRSHCRNSTLGFSRLACAATFILDVFKAFPQSGVIGGIH